MPEGRFQWHVEEALLKHIIGKQAYSPPSTVWLALGTTEPSHTDVTSWPGELAGSGYQRKQIEFTPPATVVDTTDCITRIHNKCPIFFDQATGNWAGWRYIGIWDAQISGNLLAWAAYVAAVEGAPANVVKKGRRQIFWNCDIEITLSKNQWGGGDTNIRWSKFLQEKVLNMVFRGQSWGPPSLYLAISINEPTADQTGSDLQELASSTGYARRLFSPSEWDDPFRDTAIQCGDARTSQTLGFAEALQDWIPLPGIFSICDAASGGNLLFWEDAFEPAHVFAGDSVVFSNVNLQLH